MVFVLPLDLSKPAAQSLLFLLKQTCLCSRLHSVVTV
uniref:Uncharacterized protein n=1 Tax=Anguilla anguilla TaxID=7936 RepID=A0A0E9TU93_ANGAN